VQSQHTRRGEASCRVAGALLFALAAYVGDHFGREFCWPIANKAHTSRDSPFWSPPLRHALLAKEKRRRQEPQAVLH